MKTIVFSNRKGGCGKTTSVVNVGAYFASLGYKTLIVDFDSQGHSSLYFNLKENTPSVVEVIQGTAKAEKAIHKTYKKNLDILVANGELGDVEDKLRKKKLGYLRSMLDSLNYDFVLIDTEPSFSTKIKMAYFAADYLMTPITASDKSLDGLGEQLQYLEKINSDRKKARLPRLELSGVFLTLFRSSTIVAKKAMKTLNELKRSGLPIFDSKIRLNVTLEEADSVSKAIFDYAPNSNGALDYKLLGHELLGVMKGAGRRHAA